jgi:hypothetical protein
MRKAIDETLLPRPPQELDTPALAQATRRAAERLQDQFNLSPEAAEAFAAAVVDPAEIRKAADNPERLYVPGGTLLGLRTRVWARRVLPDPRNPRIGPARRHPIAVRPGSTEDARFRPVPDPAAHPEGRPELHLEIHSREHLSWASAIAKKYILKDNDWRLSIRNQGVMTEVWLSAVTLVHDDGTSPVTVPVTSEGSSRVTACHDILDIRSADVPYVRDDRALRSIVRGLNDAVLNGPTVEEAEALRCETLPALLLVGFEPNPGSIAAFATAVRSLVALRHVDYPKPWDDAAKMESIADAVLERLASEGLITSDEERWLAGAVTTDEALASGFPADSAIRAARIVRLLTDADPSVHHTIRVAITGQTTKERITNKFKLQVAAALIMRSVAGTDERQKVADIYRGMQTGFSDTLATTPWRATYRSTDELVQTALAEVQNGGTAGSNTLELAARAAYPLITARQLLPDRGTQNNDQVDRRVPGAVIERMRTNERGVRQLGQALHDDATRRKIRAVASDGSVLPLDADAGEQEVSDNWLRRTFPPPGRPVAPPAPETAHEHFMQAISQVGIAMDRLSEAASRLSAVEGVDGRPLIEAEGIDPTDADAWLGALMGLLQLLSVWKAIHVGRRVTRAPADEADDELEDADDGGSEDDQP